MKDKKKASVKPKKESNLDKVGKGHVKLLAKEKVLKNKVKDPKDYRSVRMLDSKNTTLFVKKSDKRSDKEVRADWREKREEYLQNGW